MLQPQTTNSQHSRNKQTKTPLSNKNNISYQRSTITMSTFHDGLTYENDSRPPMLLPGTYTAWRLRFKLWLTNHDDAELMLKSIIDGPYEMKFIADQGKPGIIRL